CRELFERVFAQRLKHSDSWRTDAMSGMQKAVLDQSCYIVQHILSLLRRIPGVRDADGLNRLQGAAAREHADSPEEDLLVAGQQVVAPGDSRSQCPLPVGQIARASREQW